YGKTPMYTLTRLSNGMLVHVPGEISEEKSEDGTIQLKIDAWPENEYKVLITGVAAKPGKVSWNDKDLKSQYLEKAKALIVTLRGDGILSVAE
ncbi:MAG: hypothetical protein KAH23_04785, partial [Kiritimatiellae bacterium]|nr:hypothetical protein [Kiritimatiellia bacterium]